MEYFAKKLFQVAAMGILIITANAALGQDFLDDQFEGGSLAEEVTIMRMDDDSFVVRHKNTITVDTPMEQFYAYNEDGDFITVRINRTDNMTSGESGDTWTLIEWPMGYVPDEFQGVTPELTSKEIWIRPYLGN